MDLFIKFGELTGTNYRTLTISELCHVDYILTWNPTDGPFGSISIQSIEIIGNLYQISDSFFATDENFRKYICKYIEDNAKDYGDFNDQIYKFVQKAKQYGLENNNDPLWFFKEQDIEYSE